MDKHTLSLLNKLQKTSKTFWNISPETGKFLYQLILDRKIKTALEIGTSNGYSGLYLASALKKTGGHLTTIESHKERHDLATKNFQQAKLTQYITQILGHAPEDLPRTNQKFDLLFFDATKYEHLSYLETLKPKLKNGSFIITDNILSHQKELASYTKALQADKSFLSHLLNIDSGLLFSFQS